MNDTQAAPRSASVHLGRPDEPGPDGHAVTKSALSWLGRYYLMNDRQARILLSQAARQDGVTEAEAAQRLFDDLRARRSARA